MKIKLKFGIKTEDHINGLQPFKYKRKDWKSGKAKLYVKSYNAVNVSKTPIMEIYRFDVMDYSFVYQSIGGSDGSYGYVESATGYVISPLQLSNVTTEDELAYVVKYIIKNDNDVLGLDSDTATGFVMEVSDIVDPIHQVVLDKTTLSVYPIHRNNDMASIAKIGTENRPSIEDLVPLTKEDYETLKYIIIHARFFAGRKLEDAILPGDKIFPVMTNDEFHAWALACIATIRKLHLTDVLHRRYIFDMTYLVRY